jgi:pimeloyl-ACP methyl ester carboxylesterase
VKSGEVHIAYQVLGDGPTDLVFVSGFTSHCEYQWEEPTLAQSLRRMASFSRLIWMDKRGTGLSDPVSPDRLSLELRMRDMNAVLDAVGSTRAALLGASDGGPMCTLYAATYPDRVSHLILYAAWARFLQDVDYPFGLPLRRLRRSPRWQPPDGARLTCSPWLRRRWPTILGCGSGGGAGSGCPAVRAPWPRSSGWPSRPTCGRSWNRCGPRPWSSTGRATSSLGRTWPLPGPVHPWCAPGGVARHRPPALRRRLPGRGRRGAGVHPGHT